MKSPNNALVLVEMRQRPRRGLVEKHRSNVTEHHARVDHQAIHACGQRWAKATGTMTHRNPEDRSTYLLLRCSLYDGTVVYDRGTR